MSGDKGTTSVTFANTYEELKKKYDKREKQVIATTKVIEILASHAMEAEFNSVNVINACNDLEMEKAEVYFL